MPCRTLFCIIFASILLVPFPVKAAFTMESAVMRALEHNPSIESSRLATEAARSARKAASSSFGPSLGASYSYSRYSKDRPSRYEPNVTTLSVRATQPLFTGFNLLNSYQKAALEEKRKHLELKQARLSTVLSVQEAFISYLRACESIRSTKSALERAHAQLNMAKMAWDIGLRPRLDMLQAEVEVARVEALIISHENDREVWRTKLASLLDLPSEHEEYTGDLSLPEFNSTLEGCLKKAMAQRPDLLLARNAVDIAYKDLGIVRSSFWPQLSAVAGWSTTGSHLDAAGSRYTTKDYSYGEFGLSIDWTLFTSGRRIHLTHQAERQVASLESAVKSALNDCAYAVRACLLSVQDAFRAVQVARRAVTSARESYEDAKLRYEVQSGSYLELLTAQSALSDAELAEISSRADGLLALAQLYKDMGELHPDLREEYILSVSADGS